MKKIIALFISGILVACGQSGCSKAKGSGLKPNAATNSVAASDGTNAASDPVELKVKWQTGKKYHLQMENIQSWESAGNSGNPQEPNKVTMGMTHDYKVSVLKDLADGGKELEFEFSSQKMFYQMGEIPVLNFDSKQDPAQDTGNPVAPVLRKMLGARVRCFIDASGRVTKFEGFKELRTRMTGAQPQLRAMLEAMYNETNLKQLCDFAAALQPADAVNIGDTWPVHLEMPDPVGLMVINMNCTLKDWEPQGDNQCVRIEYKGDLSSKTPENGKVSPTQIQDGTVSGKAWFDPGQGRLINSATEQHMTLQTAMSGKTITTKFNLTINVRQIGGVN
jgi:hypothetical protein